MIFVPENIWSQMLDEFAKEPRKVEQVCYLDGVISEESNCESGVVTTLTVPNAILEPGRFQVPPDAMSEAGKHLRRFRLRRIAQVHTHPTEWTGHSQWDDELAYSQVPGAVSIVLPKFARNRPQLDSAGVHFRTARGWQELLPSEVALHIRIVPSSLDFRPTPNLSNERKHIKSPRRRPWWHFFTLSGD